MKFKNLFLLISSIIFTLSFYLSSDILEMFLLSIDNISNIFNLITYSFFHSDISHLLNNLVLIYVSANVLEKTIGSAKVSFIFFFSVIIGGLSEIMFTTSYIAGASAGVMGLLGSFLIIKPFYKIFNIRLSIFIWCLLFFDILDLVEINNIANNAHIGGFLGGVFSSFLLKKSNI